MTYDVVFTQDDSTLGLSKAVGENLFLSGLPSSPKVFAFYYPGSSPADEVVVRLRALGETTGNNLFVNIGTLADPRYETAARRFKLKRSPVVVVTAISPLAATPDGNTAFVRLDGASLFKQPEALVQTVEALFNLFLAGKVKQAALSGWVRESSAALADAASRVWNIIKPVVAWAGSRDLSFEFATVKIEVKESGPG